MPTIFINTFLQLMRIRGLYIASIWVLQLFYYQQIKYKTGKKRNSENSELISDLSNQNGLTDPTAKPLHLLIKLFVISTVESMSSGNLGKVDSLKNCCFCFICLQNPTSSAYALGNFSTTRVIGLFAQINPSSKNCCPAKLNLQSKNALVNKSRGQLNFPQIEISLIQNISSVTERQLNKKSGTVFLPFLGNFADLMEHVGTLIASY